MARQNTQPLLSFTTALFAMAASIAPLHAAQAGAPGADYIRDVQPILAEHCFQCHGQDEKQRKGGLRLDVREMALKGGKHDGAAIVAGKPDASAVIKRVSSTDDDEVMPPPKEKKALSSQQRDVLSRWIAGGANYAQHWAFVAPVKAPLPAGTGENPVDAFVRAKLKEANLEPASPADTATVCRRLYLDLIGLPPAPQEVDAFTASVLGKGLALATQDLAQQLMSSLRYGERWARVWLDAARYADSNGYEKDLAREQWAWRDWVVNALNQDMPYDEFLIEQLAGDMLPHRTQEQLIATGFLRNGLVNEEGAIVPEQFRMEGMFDRIDCIGKAALGLTLQCAQCHSHKFDPITQDEYYGIFAFLNNGYEAQSWVYTKEQQKSIDRIKAGLRAADEKMKRALPDWQAKMAAWEATLQQRRIAWTPIIGTELSSTSGLNHPTQMADGSVLSQGHPTTRGDIFVVAEPKLEGVTGLQIEALKYGDMPFGGPGRSLFGTWALSELEVSAQRPGSTEWEKLKLKNATADFAEPAHALEPEWEAAFDKDHKRTCGPVDYLIDGKDDTAWRADRGRGRRNAESVAVIQFDQPLHFPEGTKLKVLLKMYHSGDDNGRHNTMLGRSRLSLTTALDPKAEPVDYAALQAMQTPEAQRNTEQRDAIFAAWTKTLGQEAKDYLANVEKLWKQFPAAQTSVLHLAERDAANSRATYLLDRGGWDKPKQGVAPHVPASLHSLPTGSKADRLSFARWIADKRSPLTARVAVNRVWQSLFGIGLVETSEDFGTRTAMPEYRDLLDWLAVDFMEHGWSQKHLLSTIVNSAVYQQSSHATAAMLERDPRNRLLARGPRFRADAEVVRDIALTASGLITQKLGGPSIFPPVPENLLAYNYFKVDYWKPPTGPERYRRSLYLFRKRSMPDPSLTAFDAPNGDFACARRVRSNTPLAALTGLNEPIFVEAAQALALRILREGGKTDADRTTYAYRLCTGHSPKDVERNIVLNLLKSQRQRLADGWLNMREIATGDPAKTPALPPDATPQDAAAWTLVGRVLLNLDETVTKS